MISFSRSFGRREKSFIREQGELRTKLEAYNSYYADNARSQVASREVNGRLILEGIIKVYWGTEASVRLKEFDDTRLSNNTRQMKTMSVGPDFMAPGIFYVLDLFAVVRKFFLPDLLVAASESEDNEDETDGDTSLPYFNPRTHPLYTESLKDLNKTPFPQDPLYDKILDQALLEDVANDNLLSYDPIQKWKTLHSLVSDSDEASDHSPDVTAEEVEDGRITEAGTERLHRSMSVQNGHGNKNLVLSRERSLTLPSQFKDLKDDLDDLLQVERQIKDHERVYHTVNLTLPLSKDQDENKNLSPINKFTQNPIDIKTIESRTVHNEKSGKKFTVDKLSEKRNSSSVSFKLDVNESSKPSNINDRDQYNLADSEGQPIERENKDDKFEKRRGPRALRRRHGKRMDKKKLKRRSSINGHW